MSKSAHNSPTTLVVIWTDWYAYHVARLRGLLSVPKLANSTVGIELVGGIGVHAGLKFREAIPGDLPVRTLLPDRNFDEVGRLKLSAMLWGELNRLNPAAVLVPGYATWPAIAAALWCKFHCRISILMTESTAYDHARARWKERIKSSLVKTLFDSAITGGRAHVRYLEQLKFAKTRIAPYYDVVDNEGLKSQVRELRSASRLTDALPDSPYFLYVGRLAPEKNVDGLIEAWIAYREGGGVWPLVIVGDGPLSTLLKQLALNSPFHTDVYFAGLKNSSELGQFYAFAGCFVLSSKREPWGLVVNEAMASGLPVLVSNRCGSSEDLVKANHNGFTFDPDSRTDLVLRMKSISALTPELRQQMGECSQKLIAPYSPQNFGIAVASLLKTAGV